MRNHTILFFHGSRLASANVEALRLAEIVRADADTSVISVGFLEFGTPSLSEALETAVLKGGQCIRIFPLFILGGRHLEEDFPRLVSAFQSRHPDVEIIPGSPLASDSFFQEWLTRRITNLVSSQ